MQFAEKWEFACKKQRHCSDGEPLDRRRGDQWDHVALDREHRLAIDVVCGNTVFIERQNATDRHRNSRKVRKTYRFTTELSLHEASTCFTMYPCDFRWPVRTLRVKVAPGHYEDRTPAMVAGLTDHVWTLQQWLTYPARIR